MSDDSPGRWVDKTAFVMPVLPPELGIDPVLAGLLHCMAFLELSGDDAVDPDWAVEAMERVAAYVQRLPEERLNPIRRDLGVAAAYARDQGATVELLTFIEGFLDACGLEQA